LTVGQLIKELGDYPADTPVYLQEDEHGLANQKPTRSAAFAIGVADGSGKLTHVIIACTREARA